MTHFWNDCATYYKNNKERFIQWYDMKNCVSHDLPHCDYNSIFGSVCVLFLEQQNLRFSPLVKTILYHLEIQNQFWKTIDVATKQKLSWPTNKCLDFIYHTKNQSCTKRK